MAAYIARRFTWLMAVIHPTTHSIGST